MRTAVATCMALLLVCASTAAAADINGQWHGQVARGGGLTDYYFTFKVDGAKLTGRVDYPQGDYAYRMEILEGKVSGDDISFAVLNKSMGPTGPGKEARWTFTGKVQGNEIAFTLERPATQMPGAPAAPGAPPAAPGGTPPAAAGGAPPAASGGVTRVEFTATRATLLSR